MIFEDIEYQIIRSKRKSLSLEVTRNAEVIVRAPLNMPEIIINEFLFRRYEWIKNSNKALLVTGARQIGKTWLIRDEIDKSGFKRFEINMRDSKVFR